MRIRMEIDKVNGKSFNIELPDLYYDGLRDIFLSIKTMTKINKGDA